MATHGQMATQSGFGERQNLGAVNSFEGKKGVVNFNLRTCKMCLFLLHFVKIFVALNAL